MSTPPLLLSSFNIYGVRMKSLWTPGGTADSLQGGVATSRGLFVVRGANEVIASGPHGKPLT
jgi:hypothetical protein